MLSSAAPAATGFAAPFSVASPSARPPHPHPLLRRPDPSRRPRPSPALCGRGVSQRRLHMRPVAVFSSSPSDSDGSGSNKNESFPSPWGLPSVGIGGSADDATTERMAQLRDELSGALLAEDFLRAAALRDELRALEAGAPDDVSLALANEAFYGALRTGDADRMDALWLRADTVSVALPPAGLAVGYDAVSSAWRGAFSAAGVSSSSGSGSGSGSMIRDVLNNSGGSNGGKGSSDNNNNSGGRSDSSDSSGGGGGGTASQGGSAGGGGRYIEVEIISMQVRPNLGWVVCKQSLETMRGKNVVGGERIATNVFQKRRGKWFMVHHHASPVFVPGEEDLGENEDGTPKPPPPPAV